MFLKDAIQLIQTEELRYPSNKIWADLGCGSGLFTRALADLIPSPATIYAIDRNLSSFNPGTITKHTMINPIQANFEMDALNISNLDGILMANSLHFIPDKKTFLEKTRAWFRTGPLFLLIEYDTDISNRWVPYPISFEKLKITFGELGLPIIKKIGVRKSLYNAANLYSALVGYSPV